MFKKGKIKIILSMFLFLFLIGCSGKEEPKEIMIGVAWPFEATNNFFNEGIDLAVNEINSSGGINGKKLVLVKKDDGGQLEQGMKIAQSFADDNQIQAVIGHDQSYISIPASTIYEQAGLVMLTPASTAPDLTQNNYQHIFRNIPNDDEIASQIAIYLSEHNYKRMVIYYKDDSYGTGLANSFEDHAELQGMTIVDRFHSYLDEKDLKRLSNRWNAFGYDGIFLASNLENSSKFIMDAGQAGISTHFFGGNALDSPLLPQNLDGAAEEIVVASVFNPDNNIPEVKQFVTNFKAEYNEMPTSYAALGYDAVKILAAAISNSDMSNRSTVANELLKMRKMTGVTGIHEFNERGDDIGDLVVLKKLQNGKFKAIDK